MLVQTYFRGNDFATIKIFDQKFRWKFSVHTYCQGHSFATIKNLDKKCRWNFLIVTYFCANDLETKKIFGSNLFPRKWYCNHKNFGPKNFRWKCLVQSSSRLNDFATIKNFHPKHFNANLWFKPKHGEMILRQYKI